MGGVHLAGSSRWGGGGGAEVDGGEGHRAPSSFERKTASWQHARNAITLMRVDEANGSLHFS